MQPRGVHKGVCGKSELFHSLKVYLNNKNRLQPIIGLDSVTECVKAGTHNKEALYLCEVCVCRLSKSDTRNHIMGSLHRYNYIKAWHPHFVAEWKDNADLSKLAWPLMEMAKLLEKREGPGDVQVLEFKEAIYKEMTSLSEIDAVTLLKSLRCGWGQSEPLSQSETSSAQLESCTIPSHRVVLPPQKHQGQSKKPVDQPLKVVRELQKRSAQADSPPPSVQSAAAPSVKLKGPLKNNSVQSKGNCLKSLEPSVQAKSSNSFLDVYTGTKPLIGLNCVVECRSEEDDHTYGFLCHCCRIKSVKRDIIDHLTSSSHLFNYMMEVHPERVEVMTAGIHGDSQLLQSAAKNMEQEEGRGEFKVMRVPASLGILLTGNSYHWCINKLSSGNSNDNGWTSTATDIHKRKLVKGQSVGTTEASNQSVPQKRTAVQPKQAKDVKKRRKKRMMKKKMENVRNPVFKVSLPLTEGSLLLERTSFSPESLPVSPTASPAPSLTPEPETENQAEHTTSQPQFDFCSGELYKHANGQYLGQERNFKVTQHQKVYGYFSESQCFNQSENTTGTNPHEQRIFHNQQPARETEHGPAHSSFLPGKLESGRSNCLISELQIAYKERDNGGRHHIQKGLIKTLDYNWQAEGGYRDDEDVYHTQDQSTYNYNRREEGCTQEEQWYGSNFQNKVGLKVEVPREGLREISSHTNHQQFNQQQPQQYLTQDYTYPPTDRVEHHASTGEMASHLDRSNMDLNQNDSTAHGSAMAAGPRPQFFEMEQTGMHAWRYSQPSSGHVQTPPDRYMIYPPFQGAHWGTSDPYYTNGPSTNLGLHPPQPNTGAGGHRSQPNVSIPPEQTESYGTHSGFYSRGTGNFSSDMVITEIRWVPSPYINTHPCPSPQIEHVATPHWDFNSVQSTGVPSGSSHTQTIQPFF